MRGYWWRITCARALFQWQCCEQSENATNEWAHKCIVCIYNFVYKSPFCCHETLTLVHWFTPIHIHMAKGGWRENSLCAFIIIHVLWFKSRTLPNPPQCESTQTCKRYTWCRSTKKWKRKTKTTKRSYKVKHTYYIGSGCQLRRRERERERTSGLCSMARWWLKKKIIIMIPREKR